MYPNVHCSTIYNSWRRQWQPTPALLPGKSHGQRSLVDCSPCSLEESDTTERLHFHALEKEMATHSSVLAWRIPGMGEPGGLLSMVSNRARLRQLSSSSRTWKQPRCPSTDEWIKKLWMNKEGEWNITQL